MNPPSQCPLCQYHETRLYLADDRHYWQCGRCDLVFVDSSEHLSEQGEKSRYDLHQNDPNDLGYRSFLNRLITPLAARLPSSSKGLDFGCGPGPTVSILLAELGHDVACYDKYYAHDSTLLEQRYDFITATEVVEHLREPAKEFSRLMGMLRPNGYFGIMTKLLPPENQFVSWYYRKDPTHICFYAERSFEWLATEWNLSLEIIADDVVILRSGN